MRNDSKEKRRHYPSDAERSKASDDDQSNVETFTRQMFGVYAGDGFPDDGPIVLFRNKDDAEDYTERIDMCDCVVIETKVDGTFKNE